MNNHFKLQEYLDRIKISKEEMSKTSTGSFDQLSLLVKHYRESIPFENLAACQVFPVDPKHADVSIGERISLHPSRIFQKLVIDRRGGWCFEQNALLATALRALGYSLETICGRVISPFLDASSSQYRVNAMTHMLLVVNIDGKQYLCDVGFGGRGEPPVPILISETKSRVVTASGESYELRHSPKIRRMHEDTWTGDFYLPEHPPLDVKGVDPNEWVLYYGKSIDAPLYPVYAFSLSTQLAHIDYDMANWYSSTHPLNRFTQIPVCGKRTSHSNMTLAGREFKETRNGQVINTKTLQSDAEVAALLADVFDLHPPQLRP